MSLTRTTHIDPRWKAVAEVLVHYSTAVQPGERVMIAIGEIESFPLAHAVYEACIKAGAFPQVQFLSEKLRHSLLQHGTAEQHSWLPEIEAQGMSWADVYFGLRGAYNLSMHDDIPAATLAANQAAMGKISTLRWQNTRWCLVRVPNTELARQADTDSGGAGSTALSQDEAVAVMLEKYEVCCALFHGFDRSRWSQEMSSDERMGMVAAAQDHILAQENGKDRCLKSVRALSRAFALSVPHEEAMRIRDDLAFFQNVQVSLAKGTPGVARPEDELDHAIRQIISRAIAPEGVVDIFKAAGLDKPDVSILSEEFLAEVRGMPHRNLAVELLQKLLKSELATRRRKNLVEARSFAEMLEKTLLRYQNRAVEAAQVIEELILLARKMRKADSRGEKLGLTEEELAFYDALETNDSAVKVLGDETLHDIARELVNTVRNSVTIDWTLRENVRANLRRLVRRTLRKYGYPPDKQEKATLTVLEQAETLSEVWAMA